jgi:hypothetical protein
MARLLPEGDEFAQFRGQSGGIIKDAFDDSAAHAIRALQRPSVLHLRGGRHSPWTTTA